MLSQVFGGRVFHRLARKLINLHYFSLGIVGRLAQNDLTYDFSIFSKSLGTTGKLTKWPWQHERRLPATANKSKLNYNL